MARYIIVYKDNEQLESTLHIDKCPHIPTSHIIEVGEYAGCFTAMLAAKQYSANTTPCAYCCGALFYSEAHPSEMTPY